VENLTIVMNSQRLNFEIKECVFITLCFNRKISQNIYNHIVFSLLEVFLQKNIFNNIKLKDYVWKHSNQFIKIYPLID